MQLTLVIGALVALISGINAFYLDDLYTRDADEYYPTSSDLELRSIAELFSRDLDDDLDLGLLFHHIKRRRALQARVDDPVFPLAQQIYTDENVLRERLRQVVFWHNNGAGRATGQENKMNQWYHWCQRSETDPKNFDIDKPGALAEAEKQYHYSRQEFLGRQKATQLYKVRENITGRKDTQNHKIPKDRANARANEWRSIMAAIRKKNQPPKGSKDPKKSNDTKAPDSPKGPSRPSTPEPKPPSPPPVS